MFRKVAMLTAIVLVLLASGLQADVIHSTWIGGSYGKWGEPTDWNPGIVPDNGPTSTFVVTINAGDVDVVLTQDRVIDELHCYGDVTFHLRWEVQLTVINGLTNHGHWHTTTGDSITVNGSFYNLEGASIGVEEMIAVDDDLQNAGLINVLPYSSLFVYDRLYNTSRINIYGGELTGDDLLDNDTTGTIKGFGVVYAAPPLVNKGTIHASGGSLAIGTEGAVLNKGILVNAPMASLNIELIDIPESEPPGGPQDANNSGIVTVNAGGGVVFDCNLVNEPNGTIQLLGGNLSASRITQRADANLAGFGGITGDVVIDPDSSIQLTGPTNIVGDVRIEPDATLEISDGLTLITGHTTCNGTIHMRGGYVIPQGGLSGDCNVIWEPGLYTNVADFNLDGRVNFKDLACFANTWLWESAWH